MFNLKSEAKTLFFLFLIFLCFYLIFIPGNIGGDGLDTYLTVKSLISKGNLHISPDDLNNTIQKRAFLNPQNGHYYSKYGIFYVLIMMPFYLLGILAAKILPFLGQDIITKLTSNFTNCFITALIIIGMYVLARIFKYSVKVSVSLSLILGFTTMLWNYATESFSEPLTGLLLLFIVIFAVLYKKDLKDIYVFLTFLFLGLLVLTKIYNIILFIPLLIYVVFISWKKKNSSQIAKTLVLITLTTGLFLILVVLLNKIRFGGFIACGYGGRIYDYKFLFNFLNITYGFLFSSGRSIFLYNLVLIVALFGIKNFYKKNKNEALLFSGFILIYFILLAPLEYWAGGRCWGPRYLYIFIPLILLPLGEIYSDIKFDFIKRRILPVFIVLAILIQLPSVMIGYFNWEDIASTAKIDSEKIIFVPKYSQIAGSWIIFTSSLSHIFLKRSNRLILNKKEIELSDYDKISPVWFRALSGKMIRKGQKLIYLNVKQRIAVGLWLSLLVLAVVLVSRKLYLELKYLKET